LKRERRRRNTSRRKKDESENNRKRKRGERKQIERGRKEISEERVNQVVLNQPNQPCKKEELV